jgi:hypothetical protein
MALRTRICPTFTGLSFLSRYPTIVNRIEITTAAYDALATSAIRGLIEPQRSPEGGYFIWLAPKALKRIEAVREPAESYSDAILRIAKMETAGRDVEMSEALRLRPHRHSASASTAEQHLVHDPSGRQREQAGDDKRQAEDPDHR